MRFSCEKSVLQEACSIVTRAVPSKSPMPSLEGILISAGTEKIRLTGYDLKKAIYTDIDAQIQEPGSAIINARFLNEMIRRMPDGIISIECDAQNKIRTVCGKSEYNFIGLEVEEYPEMPTFSKLSSVQIPQKILRSMINQTIFAVSKDEVRPIYTGTLFEIIDGTLTLVSVDGYRLARRCEKLENYSIENCTFVVPGFTLSDVEKICEDTEDAVFISLGDKHISFTIDNTVIISRRLEGDFLSHRKSVPENFKFSVELNRQEIISVVDRVSLMLSEKNSNPVHMIFNDGTIDCFCSTPLGKAEDICICEGSGEGLEIGLNDRYLIEALKAADTEKIHVCFNTSSSPCVIKPDDESDTFTYMVLPIRIHSGV